MSRAVIAASPMTEEFLNCLEGGLNIENNDQGINKVLYITHTVLNLFIKYHKHHSQAAEEALIIAIVAIPKSASELQALCPSISFPE